MHPLLCYQSPLILAADAGAVGPAVAAEGLPVGLTLLMWLAGGAVVLFGLGVVYAVARWRIGQTEPRAIEDVSKLRVVYLIWLLVYLGIVIYGSLVPLQIRPVAWNEAVEKFRNVEYLSLNETSRADWVANILLFIPLAYLAAAVLTLGVRSWLVRIAAVVVVAASSMALCVVIEFVQIWFFPRTVSLNDILAESIGSVIGATLWLLLGTTVHQWLAAYFSPQRRRTQIDQLLEFYLAGLVVYSLLPLDLTISPAELYRKFRDGKVLFLPFSEYGWDLHSAYAIVTNIAIFIPVGMYCATAFTSEDQPLRSLKSATLWGVAVAAVIEVAQLFVLEHFTSITMLGLAGVGSFIGAAWMNKMHSPLHAAMEEPPANIRQNQAGIVCLALMGVYAVVLVAVFCSGGVWESNPEALWQRFHGFWSPPFAALYRGREYNALSDVLRKILFFAPLGALGAGAIWSAAPARRRGWLFAAILGYAAGIALSIEMLQVFLPTPATAGARSGHVADFGDVLVCTSGAALGLFLTWRVLSAPLKQKETKPNPRPA